MNEILKACNQAKSLTLLVTFAFSKLMDIDIDSLNINANVPLEINNF